MRRSLGIAVLSLWGLCADKLYKLFFGDDANLKGSSFCQFGARFFPCEDEIGFWADGTDNRSAMGLNLADKLFAGLAEGAGDDKPFSCENPAAQGELLLVSGEVEASFTQSREKTLGRAFLEKRDDFLGDFGPDIVHLSEFGDGGGREFLEGGKVAGEGFGGDRADLRNAEAED